MGSVRYACPRACAPFVRLPHPPFAPLPGAAKAKFDFVCWRSSCWWSKATRLACTSVASEGRSFSKLKAPVTMSCGGETVGAKPAQVGDAPNGQLLNNVEETVRCATCSVAQLLDYKRSTVDAFFSAVGPDVLARSVVGRQPLRDAWALRFLMGFKWDPKVAAEKFTRMVQYRVDNQLDSVRSRMEEGSLLPRQFPGFEDHHRSYVHSSFDVCSGRARGGRPLSIERVAMFDWAALFAIDEATQDAYMMHVMEWYSH